MISKIKILLILLLLCISSTSHAQIRTSQLNAQNEITSSPSENLVKTTTYIALNEQIYADEEEEKCSLDSLKKLFNYNATGAELEDSCWSCKVINGISSSFLSTAGKALSISQSLGRMLAKVGFMIWLAYYILQQVSSFAPITPGKMLQEILVMGFKVALAIGAIQYATDIFRDYLIDPIIATGVDYGLEILNGT